MAIKIFDTLEKFLARYRMVIGILILIMLIVTCVLMYQHFDKQNQIIETGGFIDGKVKCVCSQEAWDEFQSSGDAVDISNLDFADG